MTELNETILNCLKSNAYLLKQYALTLKGTDSHIVFKAYEETQRIIKGAESTPQKRADLMLLCADTEQTPFNAQENTKEEQLTALLIELGVINEYQVRNNSNELKSLKTACKGLTATQIRNVYKKVKWWSTQRSIDNFNAYLVSSLLKEAGNNE